MPASVNQDAIAPGHARALARDLLAWYELAARDLPWRHTRDPYAIWVSEVMLQQTRVEVVAGRWQRFLDRFPDIATLSTAPESEVLAEWAGLGYYRRARSLHRAAQELIARGVDALPGSCAELRLLPGFGTYTAGAVASIAFAERVAAVDGNVERVMARLMALPEDPARGAARDTVRDSATAMLRGVDPAALNQALMELGATVCTPRAPRCSACPWSGACRAHALHAQADYPRRPERKPAIAVTSYVGVARNAQGEYLFRQRPAGGHNAGLWELPRTEFLVPESVPDPSGELRSLAAGLGQDWEIGDALVSVPHTITRHRITLIAYRVVVTAGEHDGGGSWLSCERATGRGLTAATAKILKRLPPLL